MNFIKDKKVRKRTPDGVAMPLRPRASSHGKGVYAPNGSKQLFYSSAAKALSVKRSFAQGKTFFY